MRLYGLGGLRNRFGAYLEHMFYCSGLIKTNSFHLLYVDLRLP
jgi:hypothetical protein